jgi:hypothetical protein
MTKLIFLDKQLPRADRNKMDAPLQQSEMWDAVRLSNRDKSPGLDGLPVEFYEAFWAVLATPFHTFANDMFINGVMFINFTCKRRTSR